MDTSYWVKQGDKPLFPELEWSRPENRQQAGKLLIIGGNGYEFKAPANAYGDALEAGIGTATVLLPNSMQRVVSDIFPEAEFAPSTPSGSFAHESLAPMLSLGAWADGVLLPGDIGRNSETTVLIEHFLEKYSGQVTLTKDAADVLIQQPLSILQRRNTLLVVAMGQLRQLGSAAHFPQAFTTEMGLVQLAASLHEFTKRFPIAIIARHQNHYIVAVEGQVSTTMTSKTDEHLWRLVAATRASVWWLQSPAKPFEALTTAVSQ
jgi:NAD(P)H-hydrate repair Nnr-like enzyme with NAD(P)H-hydrate dehydratase domain